MSAAGRPAADVVGLADLYTETVEACVVALFILAGVVLAIGAIGRNTVDGATAGLATALAVIALVARRIARAGAERMAVTAIVAGLVAVLVAALARRDQRTHLLAEGRRRRVHG